MSAPPRPGLPRAFDLAIAMLALLISSPLLLLAILAIRLGGGGGAIYRSSRAGLGGEEFELLKLRTMRPGSDPVGVGVAVTASDSRVTRVGRFLRRFSLDELPNFVNVVRGEMAVVGPRPTLPAQVELYTARQRRRLEVPPGITGWAQVNGFRGETSTLDLMERRVELDLWYVNNWSFWLDLRILWKTLTLAPWQASAY